MGDIQNALEGHADQRQRRGVHDLQRIVPSVRSRGLARRHRSEEDPDRDDQDTEQLAEAVALPQHKVSQGHSDRNPAVLDHDVRREGQVQLQRGCVQEVAHSEEEYE